MESPLPLDECWSRLLDSTARLWGKPVLRNLFPAASSMVLRISPGPMRNSFGTRAAVRLEPTTEGTWVTITLRSDYLPAAFMTFWLGFAVLLSLVGGTANGQALWFTLVFPIVGFGFLALCRFFARPDGAKLLDFVRMLISSR